MSIWNPFSWGDESDSAKQKREDLRNQAAASSAFAEQAQRGLATLSDETSQQRNFLRDLATGKGAALEPLQRLASGQDSISAEQLRQGLQQNVAAQRSLAAGAAPANAAMAARTASIQAARLGSGMAGQQAIAGLQERQQAQQALSQERQQAQSALTEMLMQQRQQELQAA